MELMELKMLQSVVEEIGIDDTPGVGIVFDTGQLTVFNSIDKKYFEEFDQLLGKTLVSILETKEVSRQLIFENGAEIVISLVPNKENGPESMVFYGNDGVIVVWN
jgi:hypothetical protein